MRKTLDTTDEIDESKEDDVKFLESGKDATESFQSAEKPFHLVAFLVAFSVVFPGIEPVGFGRNYGNHAQIEHQLPRFIALVSLIHPHEKPFLHGTKFFQQRPPFGRIVSIAWRERKTTAVRASAATI